MKFLAPRFLTILGIALLTLVGYSSAEDVLLRLDTTPDAKVIGSVPANDPVVLEAAPVLDSEKASSGWMWSEYTTTTQGYVPNSAVGKNFAIAPETFVRAAPSRSAAILTTTLAEDAFVYLATEGEWTKVSFTKPIPVYFQLASSTVVAAAPVSKNSSEGKITVSYGSAPAPAPQPKVAITEAPIIEAAPVLEPIMVAETAKPTASAPRRPTQETGVASRLLTGTLIREGTGYGPRYPIRLLGKSGKRLAYVDMSSIFISDLRPYLNEQVYIRGEVRPLVPGSRELIIMARTIQVAP